MSVCYRFLNLSDTRVILKRSLQNNTDVLKDLFSESQVNNPDTTEYVRLLSRVTSLLFDLLTVH